MPMNGRFIKLRKDTIQFRLRGMVLKISVFEVTAPEVFDNSAFCMILVPSMVCITASFVWAVEVGIRRRILSRELPKPCIRLHSWLLAVSGSYVHNLSQMILLPVSKFLKTLLLRSSFNYCVETFLLQRSWS